MGSTSSSKFNDYPPSGEKKGGSGGSKGGGAGGDRCAQDLSNVQLEEVGRSAYFQTHSSVPSPGTAITLRGTLIGPRLSIDTQNGESIGFLSTAYNYLVVCMNKGFTYSGEVTTSSQKPVPSIRINLRHAAP
jgi:hypothetical protein